MKHIKNIKEFKDFKINENFNFDKKNLEFNYDIYKKIKNYPNILDPQDDKIKSMGLHWNSWMLKTISEHEEKIKSFLNDEISFSDLEKEINDKSFLSMLFKKYKSVEEIDDCYKLFDKSKDIKEQILKLLDSELLHNDLSEILYHVLEKDRKKDPFVK